MITREEAISIIDNIEEHTKYNFIKSWLPQLKDFINQQPQISDDVEEVMFTSEVVLQVLDTEIFYVIELGNNLWFTGTMKESLEFDTHRTMVINSANVYKNESTAQIISENIIKAGKFKNAKVVPYCLKPKQHIQTQASEIKRLKQENKTLNNAYNSVLRDNINVHQIIKNGDFRESCEDWNGKITITSDNDIIDKLGVEYVECLDKLNAIEELCYRAHEDEFGDDVVQANDIFEILDNEQILGDNKGVKE